MDAARRPTGPLRALLVVLLAFSVGRVVVSLPLSLLLYGPDGPDTATLGGQMFNNVVPFSATLLCLYLWVHFKERRSFRTLGFQSSPTRIGIGALVGVVMITAMVAIAAGAEQLQVATVSWSVPLVAGALLALVGFIVQASTEEILFRGYLLQAGARRWGLAIGVGLQAVVFALIHSINPGGLAVLPLLNLLLFAVFLAGWSLREGGLWAACAWHAMWNWTQGNLVGLQVSGERVDTSLLGTTPAPGSSDLLTGGQFGLEGGLLTTAVLLAGIAALAITHTLNRRRALRHAIRNASV